MSIEADVCASSVNGGAGTSEFAWRQSFYLMGLSELSLGDHNMAVVLAAHPDDESLGLGGTISTLLSNGTTVLVITATDGAPPRRGIRATLRDAMRTRQQNETRAAIGALGEGQSGNVLNVQLHLPDGNLAAVEIELVEHVARFLGPDDVCFATWEFDGQPDREAAGRAARRACELTGARLLHFPIDMWRWASINDPTLPWRDARRVSLGAQEIERKDRAINCYETHNSSPDDGSGPQPSLSPDELAHFQRSFEVVFA
jgi:LmbE family N-acetylglucosaminyl deacetylase